MIVRGTEWYFPQQLKIWMQKKQHINFIWKVEKSCCVICMTVSEQHYSSWSHALIDPCCTSIISFMDLSWYYPLVNAMYGRVNTTVSNFLHSSIGNMMLNYKLFSSAVIRIVHFGLVSNGTELTNTPSSDNLNERWIWDRSKSGCGKELWTELSCPSRQWVINSCLQDMSTEELVVQLEWLALAWRMKLPSIHLFMIPLCTHDCPHFPPLLGLVLVYKRHVSPYHTSQNIFSRPIFFGIWMLLISLLQNENTLQKTNEHANVWIPFRRNFSKGTWWQGSFFTKKNERKICKAVNMLQEGPW